MNQIKELGFVVEKTSRAFKIKQLEPHFFDYQVVDGTWQLAIFKITDKERFVFTNDFGGGNDINVFFYDGHSLEAREDYLNALLNEAFLMDATLDCEKTLAEEFAHFDYDFSRKDQFTVTMPYNESEYGTCFRGNRLTFSMDSGVIKLGKPSGLRLNRRQDAVSSLGRRGVVRVRPQRFSKPLRSGKIQGAILPQLRKFRQQS